MKYALYTLLVFSTYLNIHANELGRNTIKWLNLKKYGKREDLRDSKGLHIGLSGGINYNLVRRDFSDQPYWSYDYTLGGVFPGVDVYYQFSRRVFFLTGLGVSVKGQTTRYGFNADNGFFTINRIYLNLPLGFKFLLLSSGFSPYVEGGINTGFWIAGNWKIKQFSFTQNIFSDNYNPFEPTYYEWSDKYQFRKKSSNTREWDNIVDIGLFGGLGLQYTFKNRIAINAGFRYIEGLTPLTWSKDVKDHELYNNQTYNVLMGISVPVPFYVKSKPKT
ncbi:MAG: outer membrane beta-barrel protein [Chitinophagales bacterium]|nr:PorT family protein [Chitinophagales bacterium]MDW8274595.1 outer membrane beta-barrel protein [Chitinophagales bacterium]